jgi:hypothetical protein
MHFRECSALVSPRRAWFPQFGVLFYAYMAALEYSEDAEGAVM